MVHSDGTLSLHTRSLKYGKVSKCILRMCTIVIFIVSLMHVWLMQNVWWVLTKFT